jgi:hypothetical protein
MLARYYSSSLGRFMAVDPVLNTDSNDPQSWNKYSYVRNNPIRLVDPDGQTPAEALDEALGVVRGIAASLTYGLVGGPQPGDSAVSLEGQAAGTAGVATVGTAMIGGGLAEAGTTAVATATGVGAAAPAAGLATAGAGTYMVGGASGNMAKINEEAESRGGSSSGKKNTPDQDAVIQMGKEGKQSGGITRSEAETLKGFAKETGVPSHGPEAHPGRPFGKQEHMHVGPVNHIPVKPD